MRNMKERTKSHHIVSSSGDSPQTHASLQGDGVTSGEQVDMELNDVYSCQGAVDVSRLLRVSRAKLMQQAKYLNGNVLLDEHWQCTIRGPKNRRDGTFRVHIRYAASASRSYLPDPQRPIALDKARSVPGLMTVLPSRR
ncbi:hypothetical protein FIBSPDRAFT_761804 [Athelia psychrophila]|uniref:Uncharacterized protein n=1 Tax=Athelia psychrophila TaxID=1759441 RepID=A0A165X505_9AGAM|nr:hypothetical protein FIBSPDRAFT_761804 [Fibularhizoctonia sp. CBS 109695]